MFSFKFISNYRCSAHDLQMGRCHIIGYPPPGIDLVFMYHMSQKILVNIILFLKMSCFPNYVATNDLFLSLVILALSKDTRHFGGAPVILFISLLIYYENRQKYFFNLGITKLNTKNQYERLLITILRYLASEFTENNGVRNLTETRLCYIRNVSVNKENLLL